MPPTPATTGSAAHSPGCAPALRARLRQLLQADALDAAIEAGLMAYAPCAACDAEIPVAAQDSASIISAQQRLASAWAARDRYRTRNARLARRAAERDARRQPAQSTSSLPPAAAAILARAKAKAAGKA